MEHHFGLPPERPHHRQQADHPHPAAATVSHYQDFNNNNNNNQQPHRQLLSLPPPRQTHALQRPQFSLDNAAARYHPYAAQFRDAAALGKTALPSHSPSAPTPTAQTAYATAQHQHRRHSAYEPALAAGHGSVHPRPDHELETRASHSDLRIAQLQHGASVALGVQDKGVGARPSQTYGPHAQSTSAGWSQTAATATPTAVDHQPRYYPTNPSPTTPLTTTTTAYNPSAPTPSTTTTPPHPRGPPKCPHGKRRAQCLACYDLGQGGGSICLHRRRRDLCPYCKEELLRLRAAGVVAATPALLAPPRRRIRGPKTYVPRPPPPPVMPPLMGRAGRARGRSGSAAAAGVLVRGGNPAFSVDFLLAPAASRTPQPLISSSSLTGSRPSSAPAASPKLGSGGGSSGAATPALIADGVDSEAGSSASAAAAAAEFYAPWASISPGDLAPSAAAALLPSPSVSQRSGVDGWSPPDPVTESSGMAGEGNLNGRIEDASAMRFEGSPTPEIEIGGMVGERGF